jgi:hypothetical protein
MVIGNALIAIGPPLRFQDVCCWHLADILLADLEVRF